MKCFKGNIFTENGIEAELQTHVEEGCQIIFNNRIRQPEAGNTVTHHPSRLCAGFEYGHLMSLTKQKPCCRETGWPRADNGNLFACFRSNCGDKTMCLLTILVSGIALQGTDRDGLINAMSSALVLTRGRADSAKNSGKRNSLLDDLYGTRIVMACNCCNKIGNIAACRTSYFTGAHAIAAMLLNDSFKILTPHGVECLVLGFDDHSLRYRCITSWNKAVFALDLDNAHPACTCLFKGLVKTERRNNDARGGCSFKNRCSGRGSNRLLVDGQ